MNNSGLPARIKIPFASSGAKNSIPENSTGSMVADGLAAMDTGYPATTLVPRSAGGVPPHGEDMNGILYDITSKLQASDAGARYPFDATFATSIGGYPNGAVIMSSDLAGEWLNTTDANSTNPEGTATTSAGWVPLNFTGASTVSISTANITMTCLAAARPVLILSGTLTANRFLYVPNWAKHWTIINNCTGTYSVIISAVSGVATASIQAGTIANIYCDGNLNITKLQSTQLASTTQAGVVQLNDTLTSTSTVQALTAARGKAIADSFTGTKAENGYQKLFGGLILQWGKATEHTTINFPIAFPNACLNLTATPIIDGNDSSGAVTAAFVVSKSQFRVYCGASNEAILYWFAIGH